MGTLRTIQLHEGVAQMYGRLVEVDKIVLDETTQTSWIQLMPLGSYSHPLFGDLNITPEKVKNIVRNFELNVRETDLDIDYDHKATDGRAAGWIREVQDRGSSGLWGLIEWTAPAFRALRDKEYKYFSPEYTDEWEHPKTGVVHKDVLFGGAITNRPFLKDILPINLSEFPEVVRDNEGGSRMDPKKLRQLLGLKEDATDDEVQAAIDAGIAKAEATSETGSGEGGNEPPEGGGASTETPPAGTETPANEPVTVSASEQAALVQLAETNPAVKALLASQEAQGKQIEELAATAKLSEIKAKFTGFDTGKLTLSPTQRTIAQKLAIKLSDTDTATFFELLTDIVTNGVVELGERGGGRTDPTAANATLAQTFEAAVDKSIQLSEGKLDYITAVEQAALADPAGYEAYRASVMTTGQEG